MPYVLSAQCESPDAVTPAFRRYSEYLASVRDQMPREAYALATSDWYFNGVNHRSPHDVSLEQVVVIERPGHASGGGRSVDLSLRLLGAYHDVWIGLLYRDVSNYRIELSPGERDRSRGHRDWRYDEFRVTSTGRVEHEIEWWGVGRTGTWLIEAADVEYSWQPVGGAASGDRAT